MDGLFPEDDAIQDIDEEEEEEEEDEGVETGEELEDGEEDEEEREGGDEEESDGARRHRRRRDDGAHTADEGVEDEDEDEDEEEEGGTTAQGWGSLPQVCLWRVFWYLRDRDRVRAGLACRHWHAAMRSPSLWRGRSFHLNGRLSRYRRAESVTTLAYARHLGGYLERLEVCVCSPHNSLVARRLNLIIQGLLHELTSAGTRLRSLSLTGLDLDRNSWPRGVRGSLVRCLALFFRRGASQLDSVSLKGARISLHQGMYLLSALSLSQQHQYLRGCPGLSSLDLEDFFSGDQPVHLHPTLPQTLRSLRGLHSLGLSYSCVSDELLLALGQAGWGRGWRGRGRGYDWGREGGAMRSLRLACNVNEPYSQVVCGSSWAKLAERCPGLEVQLHVERVVNTDRLSRVLLPQMPLTDYSMTSCYFTEKDWGATPVLSMLLQYKHRLQCLTLNLTNCDESLDEELVELVQACVCLQQLVVYAFLDVRTVERLLQHRLERKSCLDDIRVCIYSLAEDTQEEEEELEEILSRFTQLVSDFKFSAHIYPII